MHNTHAYATSTNITCSNRHSTSGSRQHFHQFKLLDASQISLEQHMEIILQLAIFFGYEFLKKMKCSVWNLGARGDKKKQNIIKHRERHLSKTLVIWLLCFPVLIQQLFFYMQQILLLDISCSLMTSLQGCMGR